MHSYRRYARCNAEGLIGIHDVGCVNVAKRIVAETDTELVRQPVRANHTLHGCRSDLIGIHAFGWIVPRSTAVAVESF
ncbi:hypothetical protein D3C75_518930 [compost metagenome]